MAQTGVVWRCIRKPIVQSNSVSEIFGALFDEWGIWSRSPESRSWGEGRDHKLRLVFFSRLSGIVRFLGLLAVAVAVAVAMGMGMGVYSPLVLCGVYSLGLEVLLYAVVYVCSSHGTISHVPVYERKDLSPIFFRAEKMDDAYRNSKFTPDDDLRYQVCTWSCIW